MLAKTPVVILLRLAQRRVPGIQSVMHQPMLGATKYGANASWVNTTVSSVPKIASAARTSVSMVPAVGVIVGRAVIRATPRTQESAVAHRVTHVRSMPTVGMVIA